MAGQHQLTFATREKGRSHGLDARDCRLTWAGRAQAALTSAANVNDDLGNYGRGPSTFGAGEADKAGCWASRARAASAAFASSARISAS